MKIKALTTKRIIVLAFIIVLISILAVQYQEYRNIKYGKKHSFALSLRLKIEYYDNFFLSRVDNFDQLKNHPDMKQDVDAILTKYNFGFYRQIRGDAVYYYVLNKENSKDIPIDDMSSIDKMSFLEYLFYFKPIILESVAIDLSSPTLCYASSPDKIKIIFYKERKFVCDDSIFSASVWDAFDQSLDVNGLRVMDRFEIPDKEGYQVLRTVLDSSGKLKSSLYCSSSAPSFKIDRFIDSLDYYLNKIPKPTNLTVDSMFLKTFQLDTLARN